MEGNKPPMALWEAMRLGAKALRHRDLGDEDGEACRSLRHFADVLERAHLERVHTILYGTGDAEPIGILHAKDITS